jgi:staphylococcal nuclease domain-containing protein 1
MNAEQQGKAGKKGQWSSKEPPRPHVNDVSQAGSGARAKQHLPFLQRAGRLAAVCEFVLSGHRLKLHIPKEGATIAFNPSGVRCPQRGQPASAGRPAVAEEPFWEEALRFTREHCLQVCGGIGVRLGGGGMCMCMCMCVCVCGGGEGGG